MENELFHQVFMSTEGEPVNIVPTKPQLRPLAPKPVLPPAESSSGQLGPLQGTSDAANSRNAALGSIQPASQPPVPQNSTPQPLPQPLPQTSEQQTPEQQLPASPNPAARNTASKQPHDKPNESNRKRKRRHCASPTTVASNSTEQIETDKDSRAESTDIEYENAPSRRRRNPPPALEELRRSHEEDIYSQGLDIRKIESVLGAFSQEDVTIPAAEDLHRVTLAPDLQSSVPDPQSLTSEDRMKKHINMLQCLGSELGKTRTIMAVYDRIRVLLVKFEVDMLVSSKPANFSLPQGITLQAYAKMKFVELSGESERWLSDKLKAADKLMVLLEGQPRYISELKHNQITK